MKNLYLLLLMMCIGCHTRENSIILSKQVWNDAYKYEIQGGVYNTYIVTKQELNVGDTLKFR